MEARDKEARRYEPLSPGARLFGLALMGFIGWLAWNMIASILNAIALLGGWK